MNFVIFVIWEKFLRLFVEGQDSYFDMANVFALEFRQLLADSMFSMNFVLFQN